MFNVHVGHARRALIILGLVITNDLPWKVVFRFKLCTLQHSTCKYGIFKKAVRKIVAVVKAFVVRNTTCITGFDKNQYSSKTFLQCGHRIHFAFHECVCSQFFSRGKIIILAFSIPLLHLDVRLAR